jgi:hypothetical protein
LREDLYRIGQSFHLSHDVVMELDLICINYEGSVVFSSFNDVCFVWTMVQFDLCLFNLNMCVLFGLWCNLICAFSTSTFENITHYNLLDLTNPFFNIEKYLIFENITHYNLLDLTNPFFNIEKYLIS